MVSANETNPSIMLGGPEILHVDDELLLEHMKMSDSQTLYDVLAANRQHLARGIAPIGHLTPGDVSRELAMVTQLSQVGSIFDYWIVERGQRVGDVGLVIMPHEREPELGFWVVEQAQGRGLVTRAARRLLQYAFDDRQIPSAVMWIKPENRRSQAVAQRLGASLIGQDSRAWLGQTDVYNIWKVSAERESAHV